MTKYFFIFFLLNIFQTEWKSLENGLEDIISKPIDVDNCKFKILDKKNYSSVQIDNNTFLILTKNATKNGNYILFRNKKYKIDTKISNNINFDLQSIHKFKYNNSVFYILELNSINGLNLNSKSFNIIISNSINKMSILFSEWADSDLSNSIGINNGKIFILNNEINSIKYYEYNFRKFIYKLEKSTISKIDSQGRICVPINFYY
jgi:hypothetical protein